MSVVATVPDAGAGAWWPWSGADVPMLASLPVLLILSGFFSGSETALFGLRHTQRHHLAQYHPAGSRIVESLLADQRMLLITILLGNMTVNVTYFVISSVLMLRSQVGALGQAGMAVGFLLLIVLLGEVGPKVVANALRVRFALVTGPLLYTFHQVISPLRTVVNHLVIEPLSRLTAPREAPPELRDDELRALLEVSAAEGVLDADVQSMLREVLSLRRKRVRDVMTPRVRMVAIPTDAARSDVETALAQSRLTRLPVHDGSLDRIVGILRVHRYLFDPDRAITDAMVLDAPAYVPGLVTLDQLLENFRRARRKSLIVVDEFGGTEGIVSIEDVVEEIVGDIVAADEVRAPSIEPLAEGRFAVRGDAGLHDVEESVGLAAQDTRFATIGGLVVHHLGRAPSVGDRVEVGDFVIDVVAVERNRVARAVLQRRPPAADEAGAGEEAGP